MVEVTGYKHPRYAESLAEFGTPMELPRSGGWILQREIAGFPYRDGMGCYPLFACRDWTKLHIDLEELSGRLVCLSLVTDPLACIDVPYLRGCFGELVAPFKEHYVVDMRKPLEQSVSKHHRYYARRALGRLSVQQHPEPAQFLDEWMDLHQSLIRKHGIRGIKAFSRAAFALQLSTPGIVLIHAQFEKTPVAGVLYVIQEEVMYAHVLGCTELGYKLGALYGILWFALEHFKDSARWCDLMGVPGMSDTGAEGIRRFKRGWSRDTRTAYLCGRIFDREKYDEILKARSISATTYFPAYRAGETD